MKNISSSRLNSRRRGGISGVLFCAGLLNCYPLVAGEPSPAVEPAPAQQDATYQNWVNLDFGGLIVNGDKAQFTQANHVNSNAVSGGIEDMHYDKFFANKMELTIDGHAIIDNSDYKVAVELNQPDVGFVRAGYTLFRTYYDANGGYIPSISGGNYPNGQFYSPDNHRMLGDNQLALDRSDAWIEFGLRLPNLPEITLRYDHETRYGQKDSTEWGTGYLNPPTTIPSGGVAGGLPNSKSVMPAFENINEKRDIVVLDATQTVFSNTDLALGMRYEHNSNSDSENEYNLSSDTKGSPNTFNPYYTTQVNNESLDMFTGHFSDVTRFSDKLWLTMAYSYTAMNSDLAGSRISGTTGYNPIYNPLDPNTMYSSHASGFLDLGGGSVSEEQVINFNLMWVPVKDLTITPAVRIGIEDIDSNAPYVATTGAVATTGTNYLALSSNHYTEIEESLDARYVGINNIVLYLKGDWDERNGEWNESTNLEDANGVTTGLISAAEDATTDYLSQKYEAGINWYPLMRLNLSLQYYYQAEMTNFNWNVPSNVGGGIPSPGTNEGILSALGLNTNDVNVRVSWHPLGNLALVSRYDMQDVSMKNAGIGEQTTSNGATVSNAYLNEIGSAYITNNMFTESVTWTPLSRLYLQGNVSYVLSQTDTPAGSTYLTSNGPSYTSPTVLNFKNNYSEFSADLGFQLDDKTDLQAEYTYYRADDYQNNITVGMPYGAGAEETTVSAGVNRKFAKNISMSLKFTYYTYRDQTSGGNDNCKAYMIYSGLQYRF